MRSPLPCGIKRLNHPNCKITATPVPTRNPQTRELTPYITVNKAFQNGQGYRIQGRV
jgi:hypothetical protein